MALFPKIRDFAIEVLQIFEQLAVTAQQLRQQLLHRRSKLFNDLENNFVHRH